MIMAIVVALDHSDRTPRIVDFAIEEAKLREDTFRSLTLRWR